MAEWLSFDKFEATIMEALESLNDLVDESDPDVNIPNIVHAFQTAERIRAIHPHHDWFHLVGLIHDLGKVSKQYLLPKRTFKLLSILISILKILKQLLDM